MAQEFSTSLILTTPPIRGQKVKDAQWLLLGHNVLGNSANPLHTLTGRLDGEYGPVTAGATKEAKYQLGYPTESIDTVFGQKLYDYLTGKTVIPNDYLDRRKTRLKTPNKLKALDIAISFLGTKENPTGTNRTPFGAWYGMNGVAWCGIFISYDINDALGTLKKPVWKYAYVPTVAQDAANGRNHMSITYYPEPGDLVTYNWDGPNCHIEFYEKDLGNGTFSAIGGNTGSNLPSSNGGAVCRSTRYHSQVSHFIKLSI